MRFGVAGMTIAVLLAGSTAPLFAAPAETGTVVLDASGLQRGDAFACRIPVDVHYRGARQLESFRIIASAHQGGKRLANTGISSTRAIIADRGASGTIQYEPVRLQFDLTGDTCTRIDSLVLTFAACVFGDRPAENCLDRVRFADAAAGSPHRLRVSNPSLD